MWAMPFKKTGDPNCTNKTAPNKGAVLVEPDMLFMGYYRLFSLALQPPL